MIGQSFTVQSDGPLLKYLISLFPERSRTSVKNMLSKGQVQVNGEIRTAFDQPLFPGDKVVILPKGISICWQWNIFLIPHPDLLSTGCPPPVC